MLGFRTRSFGHNQALIKACQNGFLELVEYLVSAGADVQAQYNYALITACEYGHLEVAKFLVSVGADVKVGDDYALHFAIKIRHIEMIGYLVSMGAQISNEDVQRVDEIGDLELLKLFVSLGVPVSILSEKAKAYLSFCKKIKEKRRHQAAKKIYYWIIPKLYAPDSISAYNLGMKGYWECFGNY